MTRLTRFAATALLPAVLGGWAGLAAADAPFTLAMPLACEVGRTCFIQQYADHDAGPGVKDYACGSRTYDGHDGVDIRVPDDAAMRRGVAVTAAAAGVVKGRRDGVADIDPRKLPAPIPSDRMCGNGVVISHPGGWETQYCHMRQGSVTVGVGAEVKAGQVLGQVGQSGAAEFPHLHLTVRKDGKWVDPFAFGAPAAACRGGASLFDAAAAKALSYKSPDLLNIGFTTQAPTAESVEAGMAPVASLTPDAAALVFYVRLIGLEKGDVQTAVLKAPSGEVMAETTVPALDRPKAQYFAFIGKRRTQPWAAGTYTGQVTVTRAGKAVLTRSATLTVR